MRRNQRGQINILLIPLILLCLLFIGAGVFAVWAYNSRQVYKDHSDQKVAVAVQAAQQQTQASDAVQFAQQAEQPLKSYSGPAADGSIVIKYPKTWSAYINESDNGGTPIDAYFEPDFVPSTTTITNAFALRVKIAQEAYDQVLQQFSSLATQGKVTVTPYSLVKVPTVVGVRVDGQIEQNKQGSMIILPIRGQTLEIFTESSQYAADFNNNILPNFTFSP
jgi:hypothetical protein